MKSLSIVAMTQTLVLAAGTLGIGVGIGAEAIVPVADVPALTLAQVEQTEIEGEEPDSSAESDAGSDAEVDRVAEEVDELLDVEPTSSGTYDQSEDDDFVPTQDVSSDQSLKFPVDI